MNRLSVVFSIFLWLTVSLLHAQERTLKGRILDRETGEPLIGASVVLEGTVRGDITDPDGYFSIDRVDEKARIIIRYIGYEQDTLSQEELAEMDFSIRLAPATTELDEVAVYGRFEGQKRALYEQKVADNIKNIIASEQIRLFPDMNAAEALQRIPGITLQRDQGEGRYVQVRGTPPELTNFNINGEQIPSPEGNVRFVGLDIISADQIEYIEVTKVLTPDMDADGIGGNVNIITKTAEGFTPTISLSLAGGYNNLMATPNYQGQFAYGQRFKKFGFHVNGSYYENHQGSHNMEFKFVKRNTQSNPEYHPVYKDIQLRHYDITRTRTGLSTTLDYRFNADNMIYIRAMYNDFNDDETRSRIRYKVGGGTILDDDSFLEPTIERDVKDRVKDQNISTINLGGENKIFGGKLDYEVAYSLAMEEQPDRLEASFETFHNLTSISLDLTETNWPVINVNDSVRGFDWTNYEMEDMILMDGLTTDRNYTYKLNYEIPYRIGNTRGEIKVGGKVRHKKKQRDNKALYYNQYFPVFADKNPDQEPDRKVYTQIGPDYSLETIGRDDVEDNLLNRGYKMDKVPDPDKIREFYEFYAQNFKLNEADTKDETYSEDYVAYEDIYAVYAMFRHHFNRLMVLGGVRYERTVVDYQGYDFQIYKGRFFQDLDTILRTNEYEFLLPQLQLKYTLNANTNIRLAGTYTYSRPNFEDILPYKQQDLDEVRLGNPNLEFPKSLNIDLLAETYLDQGGLLSAGVFYKKIDKFIFNYKVFKHLGEVAYNGLDEITQANNGLEAFVYGAEINSNVKFSFLPGVLGNFGLYLNYTYTHSEAFINERPDVYEPDAIFYYEGGDGELVPPTDETEMIPLPGQAQHTANVAIFFDAKRFYAKLASNFHDAFLLELGQDPTFDEYYDQAFHLDFSADYRLGKYANIFLEVINLTDAPLKIYLGTPDVVKQQEYYSMWGRIGFRYNFN